MNFTVKIEQIECEKVITDKRKYGVGKVIRFSIKCTTLGSTKVNWSYKLCSQRDGGEAIHFECQLSLSVELKCMSIERSSRATLYILNFNQYISKGLKERG